MAFLAGYSYRKIIPLTGETGAGTDYQRLIKVGAADAATGDNLHVEGNATDFPNDIKFTDNDGSTKLSYYIERTVGAGDSAVAHCWVKVTDDLDSNQNIYIYYGKPGDSDESDADAVFLFGETFDDLNTGVALAGQGGWVTAGGTPGNLTVEANGLYGANNVENTKNGNANAYHTFAATDDVRLIFHIKTSDDGNATSPALALADDATVKVRFEADISGDYVYYDSGATTVNILANYTANNWYRLEVEVRADTDAGNWRYIANPNAINGSGTFAGDDSQFGTWTTINRILIYTDVSENVLFDSILIAKSTGTGSEPVFGTVGDEEIWVTAPLGELDLTGLTATITNLTPVTAPLGELALTGLIPTITKTGGWDLQDKNKATWTFISKS